MADQPNSDQDLDADLIPDRMVTERPSLRLHRDIFEQEIAQAKELGPLARDFILEQAAYQDLWPVEMKTADLLKLYKVDVSQKTLTEDSMLAHIMDGALRRIPDVDTVRRLLTCILYSVRPLNTWELSTIVFLGSEYDCGQATFGLNVREKLVAKVQRWLAGIITFQNSEVKFCHPRIRSILVGDVPVEPLASGASFIWSPLKEKAHSDMAFFCLNYLARPSIQPLLQRPANQGAALQFGNSLCSYALQSWPYHVSLISQSVQRCQFSDFLENYLITTVEMGQMTLASWYWSLQNPLAQGKTVLDTLFTVFAGLGFTDIVKPQNDQDKLLGVFEAASKGHSKVVQCLVKELDLSASTLGRVMSASASAGDEEALLDLLDRMVLKGFTPDDLPTTLVYCVACLGLNRFLDKLLKLGVSPTTSHTNETTKQLMHPLHGAIQCQQVKTVALLLEHGADPRAQDSLLRNPLHKAATCGNLEIMQLLLKTDHLGLDVKDSRGLSPTYLASVRGNYKTLELLLSLGTDPNAGDGETLSPGVWSPLVVTSIEGFPKSVRLLLDSKANMAYVAPATKKNALCFSILEGHLDLCRMLLDNGADPNDIQEETPIVIQVINCHSLKAEEKKPMLELLFAHNASPAIKDPLGTPALIREIQNGQGTAIVQLLLDKGVDVDVVDIRGKSALHHAVDANMESMVAFLLEHGADPNLLDMSGQSPMCGAMSFPYILENMFEHGADANIGRINGRTALMEAASRAHESNLEMLIEHRATIDLEYTGDEEGFEGWTALSFAVAQGGPEVVRRLAVHGANLNHKSAVGTPILHLAAESDEYTLFALLEFAARIDMGQVDANGDTVLHLNDVSADNFQRLVNAVPNVNMHNRNDCDTPLTLAANNGELRRVEMLLKRGASVSAFSYIFGSALHQACNHSDMEIVKRLVERGADVNQICGSMLGTPLQSACLQMKSSMETKEEYAKYLIQHGASVTVSGGLYHLPIIAASLGSNPDIIQLLVDNGAEATVRDGMGRMPIHFAAFRGMENYKAILALGGDPEARDRMGRTAQHWAAQSGRADVLEDLISRLTTREAVDAQDNDGWTPLCWAARGIESIFPDDIETEAANQVDVLRMLLANGASRTTTVTVMVGDGDAQTWMPFQIAQYSGQSDEVVELLTPDRQPENPQSGGRRRSPVLVIEMGILNRHYCDACQCRVRGIRYSCRECMNFDLCFKCHPRRDVLHHSHSHMFDEMPPEPEVGFDDESNHDSDGQVEF